MAWNPSPQVAHARDFARKYGANRVIILYTLPDGRLGYASYGETKALCASARRLGDVAYEAVGDYLAEEGGTT